MHRSGVFLIVATLAVGCGPSLLNRARVHAPDAVRAHLADAQPLDTSAFVEVPPAFAWNRVVEAVRREAPIAEARFPERQITTHWVYETPQVATGVATQRRVRHHVGLAGTDARSFRADVMTEAQTRRRETCSEPSGWASAATAGPEQRVVEGTRSAIRDAGQVTPQQLLFPGSVEEVMAVARDVLAERGWSQQTVVEPSQHEPIETTPASAPRQEPHPRWRETDHPVEPDFSVAVRSAVAVRPYSYPSGVRLGVQASLEWRAHQGPVGTDWVAWPSEPAVEDFVGRVVARLPPERIVLPDEVPLEPRDPERPLIDLPSPPDPLSGSYQLAIPMVLAPERDRNGHRWDEAAGLLGDVVAWIPTAVRVGALVAAPPASIIALARAAWSATRRDGIDDRIAAVIGQFVGQHAAPDLSLLLMLPSLGQVVLQGPANSHVAGWTDPLNLALSGPGQIAWRLVDRDPFNNVEEVASGQIDLGSVANACERVCQHVGSAQICFELRRVR